ncbi:MAG: DUF4118 domain-containing protein [Pseudonocardia sp.]|nr:DUF4118 domain-containing protein [Pseudonocardia sp.]
MVDFFVTEPYDRFAITKRADIETAVLLMLVGVAVTEIALWGRRQHHERTRQDRHLVVDSLIRLLCREHHGRGAELHVMVVRSRCAQPSGGVRRTRNRSSRLQPRTSRPARRRSQHGALRTR